jgi:hypothetical protein
MRVFALFAVAALALSAQESGQDDAKMTVTVLSVKNAPKSVPDTDKQRRFTITNRHPGAVKYGKMVAFSERWETVLPGEKAPEAEGGEEPARYRPVLGDPVLVGLKVEAENLQLKDRRCVLGTVTLREVMGTSKLELELGEPAVEVPRVVVSTTRFQLFPPQVSRGTCKIARPNGKPIEIEIFAAEGGE